MNISCLASLRKKSYHDLYQAFHHLSSLLFSSTLVVTVGVYCFLITTLITEFNWKLREKDGYPVQVSRNRVQFTLPGNNPGCITITDSFSTFFHIDFEPPKGVSVERIHEICEKECPIIRETILTGIRKASQKLNYTNSIPEVAFPCRCMTSEESLHPAIISDTSLLMCTNGAGVCCEMTEQHHIWKGTT